MQRARIIHMAADDFFYDKSRQRIYISGGEGFLGIFQRDDADHYRNLRGLYLAVPSP